jgi:outer membrane protein TolC
MMPTSSRIGRTLLPLLPAALFAGCIHFQPRPISPPAVLTVVESRRLDDPGLAGFLQANHQAAAWPPPAWDLNSLTLVAFYYHPDLDVARSQWAAARAAMVTAGERPNPNVSVAPGYNATTVASLITPWILTLDLDFTVETAGKRGYRIAEARQLSEAARLNIASVAWQVQSRVRQSLLEVYATARTVALLDEQQQLQQRNLALIERQLAAGAISSFELTQARLVQDAMRLASHDALQRQAEAHVALAAAMGVTARALDGISLAFDAFDRTPPDVPAAEARRQALLNRPDIIGALMQYEASQAALQLEVARQYPDIHLGPGYQMDQTDHKWTLGLAGLLPAFNRNRGPIAVADARREEAAARFTGVQSRAIEEIDRALAVYQAALSRVTTADTLYADRLAQARTADAQLTAGEISRLDLGGVQLELASAQAARLDARVNVQQALGRLEDAMQRPAELGVWLSIGPPRTCPAAPPPDRR